MTAARLWMFTTLMTLGLAASLVFAGGQLLRHLQGITTVEPLILPALVQTPEDVVRADTDAIIALAPFGKVPFTSVRVRTSSPQEIKVTLRGVLVDPDPAASRAFLRVNEETAIFRLGDPVSTAELVAINTDSVTLKSDESLVIVGFDGIDNGAPVEANEDIALTVASAPADPFARLASAIVPGQGSIDLRDSPPPETKEEYITFWRDRIAQNPQAAMDKVGVELVGNGYRVKAKPNIGVTLAGLRTGDVVTRLNGENLGNLDDDRSLYDQVAASGIARLEVVRDGKALLLTFPLR